MDSDKSPGPGFDSCCREFTERAGAMQNQRFFGKIIPAYPSPELMLFPA